MPGTELENWLRDGKTFYYKGHPVFYRDEGQGEIILFIHGFPASSWDWHKIWGPLRRHFRLIALDMIGFGFSAKPQDYPYSILDQAGLCTALLKSLNVRKCHVLAHDYGDTVAQELLAQCEEKQNNAEANITICSVCFLNGGLFPEAYETRFTQRLLMTPFGSLFIKLFNKEAYQKNIFALFGPETKPAEDELKDLWSLLAYNEGHRNMHKLIRYIKERRLYRSRWVGVLQETKVPLRLVYGSKDPVSGIRIAERYQELVPEADTITLEGIGHYPHLEDPKGVCNALLEFLEAAAARH